MASPSMAPLHADTEIVPVYEFPEQAARALAKAAAYAQWRRVPAGSLVSLGDARLREARALCRDIARTRGGSWLTPQELQQLLHAADLHMAPSVTRALCGRSGCARARLRLPRRRQARIAQSGPQDRSRWCPAASRQRARGAHGVRRTVRHRSCGARWRHRRRAHPADGDHRNRNAHRTHAGLDVRAAGGVRHRRYSGRIVPGRCVPYRAADRSGRRRDDPGRARILLCCRATGTNRPPTSTRCGMCC